MADWRAELPALSPAVLAFTERRRRRLRDRSRQGDDLRRVFELVATSEVELAGVPFPLTPESTCDKGRRWSMDGQGVVVPVGLGAS